MRDRRTREQDGKSGRDLDGRCALSAGMGKQLRQSRVLFRGGGQCQSMEACAGLRLKGRGVALHSGQRRDVTM